MQSKTQITISCHASLQPVQEHPVLPFHSMLKRVVSNVQRPGRPLTRYRTRVFFTLSSGESLFQTVCYNLLSQASRQCCLCPVILHIVVCFSIICEKLPMAKYLVTPLSFLKRLRTSMESLIRNSMDLPPITASTPLLGYL